MNGTQESGCSPSTVMVAVLAGKGGVGKSSICVQMARCWQSLGLKVGILDADIYGPSIPLMAPADVSAQVSDEGVLPAQSSGLKFMSAALLPHWGNSAILRAPIANALIDQFLREVVWGDLDVLLVDFPPGTGDVPITLFQKIAFDGVIAVSTPQAVALQDVKKALIQVRQCGVPILGLIENMSGMCREDGSWTALFGESGSSEGLLHEFECRHWLMLPFEPALANLGDRGGHLFEEGYPTYLKGAFVNFASDCWQWLQAKRKTQTRQADTVCLATDACVQFVEEGTRLRFCARDGKWRTIEVEDLLDACPCIRCRSRQEDLPSQMVMETPANGRAFPNQAGLRPDNRPNGQRPRIRQIRVIGHLGCAFSVEGGCTKGIYSWGLLQQLGSVCTAQSPSRVKEESGVS
jgi:ATP-binding protein involved in chromosome partitioning